MKTMIQILCAVAVLALAGCASTPTKVLSVACDREYSYSTERCAKAVAETYEVYHKRAENLVDDPATPKDVKRAVKNAELTATNVIIEVLRSTRVYLGVKADLAAGTTTEEQLAIANAKLETWVQQAIPRLNALIASLGG